MLFKVLLLASVSLSTTLQVGSIALRRLTKSPKMQVAHMDDVAAKSSWLEKQQDMVGAVKPTGAPNMGFGGAARGLVDEQAEVAELRAMLGKLD